MKRRVIVEVITPGAHEGTQTAVEYEDRHPYASARESAIMDAVGLPAFEPIKGESSYVGWSRCIINISGLICTNDDCWAKLDSDDGELCLACQDDANEGCEK
jgi:hypothetical protein